MDQELTSSTLSSFSSIPIQKASGEIVLFSENKLRKSLLKACGDEEKVEKILLKLKSQIHPGITTSELYQRAFSLLAATSKSAAGRYKLKSAIMELGPSGYPFEIFIGELLKRQGYEIAIGQIVQGHCVSHEIDVIAVNNQNHYMVECKFHNRPGHLCDVKVPLYIQARFEDVQRQWRKLPENTENFYQGWVATNTRFSSDAIQYATCIGLNLIGWDYPAHGGLNVLIDSLKLYPLTCITSLSGKEKERLLANKVLLCEDLLKDEKHLDEIGVNKRKKSAILSEAQDLCY